MFIKNYLCMKNNFYPGGDPIPGPPRPCIPRPCCPGPPPYGLLLSISWKRINHTIIL